MRAIDKFCGMKNGYSRTTTLRNRLIPIGKTKENIEKFLPNDRKRFESYPVVKEILDRYHKVFIEIVLNEFETDWDKLFNLICEYKKCKDRQEKEKLKKDIEKLQAEKRKKISESFKNNNLHKTIKDPAKIIKQAGEDFKLTESEDFERFKMFSGYFKDYCDIRAELYKSEEGAGKIPFRIVNENFNRFVDNIILYDQVKDKYQSIINDFLNINNGVDRAKLDYCFSSNGFNQFLTQNGIDNFNKLVGGIEAKVGDNKKQGLNELINLYNQQNPANKIKGRMNVLYKQILSDRNKPIFANNELKDTNDCYTLIKSFKENLDKTDLYNKISNLFSNKEKREDLIYVSSKNITRFSQEICGRWNFIYNAVFDIEKASIKKLTEKKEEDLKKKIEKRDFSLAEINKLISNANFNKESTIIDYFDLTRLNEKIKLANEAFKVLGGISFEEINIQENENVAEQIKKYLDAELDLYHYFTLLDCNGEDNKDSSFYKEYGEIKETYSEILFIYNKVRNFITKKCSEVKKVKLNFDCPTLANGWDKGNEYSNYITYILLKEDKYYLAILNKYEKINLDNFVNDNINKVSYSKLNLKYIGDPVKNFPRWLITSSEAREKYKPENETLQTYDYYKKLKSEKKNVPIEIQWKLIDYYKKAISLNDEWNRFSFDFKDTDKYDSLDRFYQDIRNQGYIIWFNQVSVSDVDKLVEDDKLLLFQIYNKDFAKKATGKKNLHTLYLENLFSKENINNYVLALNGGAELFLRDSQIEKSVCHKKDSILVNKVDKDGKTIPAKIYTQIYEHLNGNIDIDKLDSDAKKLLDSGKVIYKKAKFDITKDKRFTETQYFFHCPITLNYKANDNPKDFNKKVRDEVLKDDTINIIGLDRGERNLIYLSLINQKGKILKQKSLNIVQVNNEFKQSKVDYQEKLTSLQDERQEARRNWNKINNIKELKEGYLSAVVHEIAEMMIKENAIVVMEDLNFGFKHSRTAIEKQIYQKFENMLLEKLNYLVQKDKPLIDYGGVLNAYQLALPHEEVSKVGKQSGWVFYIPASWTSKIDTTTGFVDLFDTKGLTNREKKIEFFKSFNKIYFDSNFKCFVFDFNYSKVKRINMESPKDDWKIYSKGERLVYKKEKKESERIDITKSLCDVLDKFSISYSNGEDIRNVLTDDINYKVIDALFYSFKYTLQMRNSIPNTSEDYLVSPVMNNDGEFFDTRKEMKKGCDENGYYKSDLPVDADANGAYHIALKGLYLLKNNFNLDSRGEKIESIKTVDWLRFVQNKEYLN